jgi:uncharacterized protein (TIRG00374 family)
VATDESVRWARANTEAIAVSRHELTPPPDVTPRGLRGRLIGLAILVLVVVGVITLLPGLASLRTRLSHADPGWLAVGAALKVLSGLSYVAVFRSVFCRRMNWRLSTQIGLSELGANAVIPTGGAGGLALGAWALRRGGMDADRIARRSVAFFLLTSVPNVLGVILIGIGLATGVLAGHVNLALSIGPALIAIGAVVLVLASRRWTAAAQLKLARKRGQRSRLARSLGAMSEGAEESLSLLRQGNLWLLSGLLGYLAFDVMILWSTFHAFGSAPALTILWIGYLVGELGGLIPLPGGIGGVDLGLVGTLTLYGVPIGSATAAVLAYRAIALVVPSILGGISLILLRRSLTRETISLADCSP